MLIIQHNNTYRQEDIGRYYNYRQEDIGSIVIIDRKIYVGIIMPIIML
jgi:hypothetical protein